MRNTNIYHGLWKGVGVLFFLDICILLLHLGIGSSHTLFHLDYEWNLPTFYQALKLMSFAAAFFIVILKTKLSRKKRVFLMTLAGILFALGFDELFQVHENIYRFFEFFPWLHPKRVVSVSSELGYRSSLWILYYLPFIGVFCAWFVYWVYAWRVSLKNYIPAITVILGSLVVVLTAEIFSSTGLYSSGTYLMFITLEEVAEMIFASALIWLGWKKIQKSLKK